MQKGCYKALKITTKDLINNNRIINKSDIASRNDHMSYHDKLRQIDELQASILEHGAIPIALLNKINYKLRLEWNYTSNSMEGNSLTKRETRTVMVNAIEVHGKPLKDIQEIKNHDNVITTIMKMGKGELNISESRIKEIHKGIMYEEDEKKKQYVGQWKNVDNYMINFDGERYDFAPHIEVPERMHQLVNWTNSEKEKIQRSQKDAIHPVALALKFHLDYLNIHPFYDGNGRTARILSNLILISYGFPPLYVKEDEKKNYYRYLTDIQTYGGEPDLFYEFMAGLILRSLQITFDVIEGKEIEEEEDFLKELQLIKAKHNDKGVPKSPIIIYNTFEKVKENLWKKLKETLDFSKELFNESKTVHTVNGYDENFGTTTKSLFTASYLITKSNEPAKVKIFGYDVYDTDISTISWKHTMFALNIAKIPVDFIFELEVEFEDFKYSVNLNASMNGKWKLPSSIYRLEKSYSVPFLQEELDDINSTLKKHLIEEIKRLVDDTKEESSK
jgi:Fic family protein